MITFHATGRFQAEPVAFTCSVEDDRIVISSESDKVFSLAKAVNAALGADPYTPSNVKRTLTNDVFDAGCKPEVTGWLKRVV